MFNNKTNKIDCKSTKCSIIGSFDVDVHFNWFKYCYLKREIRINQHLVSHTISILLWYLNLFNWTWIETGVISFAKSENLLIYFISSFCFFRNVNNVHLFEILWLEFPRKDSLSLLETRNCVLMNSMNCIFFSNTNCTSKSRHYNLDIYQNLNTFHFSADQVRSILES